MDGERRIGVAMEGYDVVVVGGGSAGCVLAARLTEDPDRSVCLIEAAPITATRPRAAGRLTSSTRTGSGHPRERSRTGLGNSLEPRWIPAPARDRRGTRSRHIRRARGRQHVDVAPRAPAHRGRSRQILTSPNLTSPSRDFPSSAVSGRLRPASKAAGASGISCRRRCESKGCIRRTGQRGERHD